MKKGIGLVLLLTLLAGCAAPQTADVFTLDDTLPQTAAACFSIIFNVPADAVLTVSAEDGSTKLYAAEDGSYTIQTAVLPGVTAERAIRDMTGFSADALHPIRTRAMGMTEYRFSWCSEDEDGIRLCGGAVFEDENCCYTLLFSSPEDRAGANRALQREVLDSFGLYEDEGF